MKKIYEEHGLTIAIIMWFAAAIVLSMFAVHPFYVPENGACKCPALIAGYDYDEHVEKIRHNYRVVVALNTCSDGEIRNEDALYALKVYEEAYAWHMKHDKK